MFIKKTILNAAIMLYEYTFGIYSGVARVHPCLHSVVNIEFTCIPS